MRLDKVLEWWKRVGGAVEVKKDSPPLSASRASSASKSVGSRTEKGKQQSLFRG